MVRVREVMLNVAIATQKRRVKFCELHGIGDTAIKEKAILKKMEHKKELRDNK